MAERVVGHGSFGVVFQVWIDFILMTSSFEDSSGFVYIFFIYIWSVVLNYHVIRCGISG